MGFQLSPVLLTGLVEFKAVRDVPDRDQVQIFPNGFDLLAMVDSTVVQEQVGFCPLHCLVYFLKELDELLLVEAVVCHHVGQQPVTGTDCSTEGLARLLSCLVFQCYVLLLVRPRCCLETSGGEDALVYEHKVAITLKDAFDSLVKFDCVSLVLLSLL